MGHANRTTRSIMAVTRRRFPGSRRRGAIPGERSARLLAAALLLSLPCGCGEPDDARPLAVVASGDVNGWIVPCGCASNQSGGLPRRGSYVAAVRDEAEVLLVDVGGSPGGTSEYDLLRFEAALRGEAAMGIDARNLGAAELALGPERLRRLADDRGAPWLSANVRDRAGDFLAEPFLALELGGRRVVLVGVVAPRYATPDVDVTPPRQAVLDAVRQAGPADWLVVLAYLPEDELRELAELLPEADLVVGGPTGQPIEPRQVGPVLLASATNQGKFLARFDAPAGPGRFTARIDELDDRYPDDPEQTANLRRFYDDLQRRDVSAAETAYAPSLPDDLPPGFAIAGTDRCRECHAVDYRLWSTSLHAHAWNSLTPTGAHTDPACQRCHTTGYGMPGGFVSLARSRSRRGIGCESCHGPSLAHADDPTERTAYFAQAASHCVVCHDRENSPEFEYETYWDRIRHGDTPATRPSDVPPETVVFAGLGGLPQRSLPSAEIPRGPPGTRPIWAGPLQTRYEEVEP